MYIDQVMDVLDQVIIPLLKDKLPAEIRQGWECHLGTIVDDDEYDMEEIIFEYIRREAVARIVSSEEKALKDLSVSVQKLVVGGRLP